MSGWDQNYDLEQYGHKPLPEPEPMSLGLKVVLLVLGVCLAATPFVAIFLAVT